MKMILVGHFLRHRKGYYKSVHTMKAQQFVVKTTHPFVEQLCRDPALGLRLTEPQPVKSDVRKKLIHGNTEKQPST